MKYLLISLALFFVVACSPEKSQHQDYVLVIHGGVIAVDKEGNYTMIFNTSGMFRGYVTADGKREVAIFGGME